MLPFSGNLSSERGKVQHLIEYGLQRLRFWKRKKMDIIHEQHVDRLCNTVCVRIDHAGHADKRNLVLSPVSQGPGTGWILASNDSLINEAPPHSQVGDVSGQFHRK